MYYAEWEIVVLDLFAGTSLVSASPELLAGACHQCMHPSQEVSSRLRVRIDLLRQPCLHRCMSISRLHINSGWPMASLSDTTPTNHSPALDLGSDNILREQLGSLRQAPRSLTCEASFYRRCVSGSKGRFLNSFAMFWNDRVICSGSSTKAEVLKASATRRDTGERPNWSLDCALIPLTTRIGATAADKAPCPYAACVIFFESKPIVY